jgi:hypothetical protein
MGHRPHGEITGASRDGIGGSFTVRIRGRNSIGARWCRSAVVGEPFGFVTDFAIS